ncbi:hypothetical protein ACFL2U_00695 [Patescibacteria group bacterium]
MFTKQEVRPKDINASGGFFSTVWQNNEKETIARNIVLISQWNGNQWLDFTWETYKDKCEHNVTIAEKSVLDALAREGYLTCTGGVYSVQDKFIEALKEYVSK